MGTVEHTFPYLYRLAGVETQVPGNVRSLVNSQREVPSARYDSLQSPGGGPYASPSGKSFLGVKLQGGIEASLAQNAVLEVGYADSPLANSATPPPNAVAVWRAAWRALPGVFLDLDLLVPIPTGKYPYIYASGAAWNFTLVGAEV